MPKFPSMDVPLFSGNDRSLMRSTLLRGLTRRSIRTTLVALSVTVLSILFISHTVQADGSAPFGLTWAMSLEDLEARGVAVRPLFTDGAEKRVSVTKLPKMLRDMDEAILSFGVNNRLRRIESRSKDFRHDADGARLRTRYKALSGVLAEKYGKGQQHHDISVTWRKPADFLMGIYRGDSVYYTVFNGKEVKVRLEIRATRRFVGHYRLVFDYKGVKDLGDGLSKERDIL